MFRSGTTTLIISNEEINVIMKIVKSLEKSGLLIKPVSEAIKNEAKEQRVQGIYKQVKEQQQRVKDKVQLDQVKVH